MFYGISLDVVEVICKYNFSWCLYGKNIINYGEGSYFVRDVFYSYVFVEKNVFGYYEMFVVKVLVGLYIKGYFSYWRLLLKIFFDFVSDFYDLCVDD